MFSNVIKLFKNISFARFFKLLTVLRMFLYLRQSSVRAALTAFYFNRSRFLAFDRMVESYQGVSLGRISTTVFRTHSLTSYINFDVNCSQAKPTFPSLIKFQLVLEIK